MTSLKDKVIIGCLHNNSYDCLTSLNKKKKGVSYIKKRDVKEAILNFHKDIFGKEIIRDRFNEAQIISPKEIYEKIEKHFGDWEDEK